MALLLNSLSPMQNIYSTQNALAKNGRLRVHSVAHAELPTRYGRFTIYGFEGRGPQEEAVALVRGKPQSEKRRRWCECTRNA